MDPSVWGPTCWRLVFTTSFRLPRDRCLDMFTALRHILPCSHCRRSYCMYLDRLPPEAAIDSTPRSAAKFAWTVKDYVNGKLGSTVVPFSTVCNRHEIFSTPISRSDVVDFLCCVALQVESEEQVAAYETFATVMDELLRVCCEHAKLHLPLDSKFRSPATLFLHALQARNVLNVSMGQPTMSREEMLRRYRSSHNVKADTATRRTSHVSQRVTTRSQRHARKR